MSTNTGTPGVVGVSASCPINAASGTLIYFKFTVVGLPDEYTTLRFKWTSDGANPLFEDAQGNRLRVAIANEAYFSVEFPPQEANQALFAQKGENTSATGTGSAKAFDSPPEQQHEQQAQQQQQPGTEEMQISLPTNAATTQGGTLTVPVTLTNSAGGKLSAFNFDVQFNPALLRPASGSPIDATGTLSSGCEVVVRALTPGRMNIAGACNKDITAASGTLVKLRFAVTGQANNANQEARAIKFRRVPLFENHQGRRLGVGRTNGSVR